MFTLRGRGDIFYEGPRKRHPHTLGLDELIGHCPWSLLCASALSICVRRPFCGMLACLAACLMRLSVTAPRYVQAVSTTAIKLVGGSWGRPLAHLLLSHSGFTRLALSTLPTLIAFRSVC
jgi:hypothetical protein